MTSIVDADDLIRSKSRRRVFFLTASLALAVLVAIRFFLIPWVAGVPIPSARMVLESTLDSFVVAVAAAVALGALLYWLGAGQPVPADMRVIEPREIGSTLQEALDGTAEWWYRGHTGRHLRSVTLPALGKEARRRNQSIAVSVQILDPTNSSTCESYAHYRRGLRTAQQGAQWTPAVVAQELYATLLSVFLIRDREPLLEFSVAVHPYVSVYRVDLSSRLSIITKEDPQEPALRCDQGTFFHGSYREDLRMAREQCKQLDTRPRIDSSLVLTRDMVRDLFRAVDMWAPQLDDDRFVNEVIAIAERAENPYP